MKQLLWVIETVCGFGDKKQCICSLCLTNKKSKIYSEISAFNFIYFKAKACFSVTNYAKVEPPVVN